MKVRPKSFKIKRVGAGAGARDDPTPDHRDEQRSPEFLTAYIVNRS